MESSSRDHHHVAPQSGDKGLKQDAIGFWDALVVGLASTAPAYSLAAVIGALAVGVGVQAPAVLLASFVPMLLIAAAFAALNRVNRYAILYRLQDAKKPETRVRRIEQFVAMLSRGETIHPQRRAAR